jgi:threonylcarbamoyladenosine tRNA methylthiotransferase MtaB
VPFGNKEDVAIVRACGVTCKASQTTREIIRKIKRQGSYIVATGCLENKELKEIDFVAKNNKEILKHLMESTVVSIPIDKKSVVDRRNRTRAFIKIQIGCNFQCAYCIIPSFRGKSRSRPISEILKTVNQKIKNGRQEIVLTGVNIGQYNGIRNTKNTKLQNDILNNKYGLADLLIEILNKTKIQRIRLESLDPRLISKKLIKLFTRWNNGAMKQNNRDRLMPHWHLSLQSGSNAVLKRMGRGYTTKQYLNIVNKLRKSNPLFSFTTDIIVGFPGETEKEFKETCEFVKKIGFTKIHIFPFSPRTGTPASKLKPVTNRIVTERVKILTAVANNVSQKYLKQFEGLTKPALFENKKGAYFYGYTPEYLKIKLKSKKKLENKIQNLKLKESNLIL